MDFRSILIVAAASWLLPPASSAQERRPEREFKSDNEKLILRIDPGRPSRRSKSACTATLIERARGRKKTRWERPLVNQIAPMLAAVRDDGRFVVTLGEFPFGGVHNALVIYGDKGQLLRHFLLTDLLDSEDWQHVKRKGKRVQWLDDVELGFESEPDHFVATLEWDKEIRVDLKTLQLVRDGEARAGGEIPPEILTELYESAVTVAIEKEVTAELMAPWIELTEEEAALMLAEADAESELDELDPDAVRDEAAVVDLRDLDLPELDEMADPESERVDTGEEDPRPDISDEPAEPQTLAGQILGQDLPEPNVAEPTDYLSWFNRFAETEGPSALPYYQAAADNYIEFEGDSELRAAAVKGDPQALESQEVREWLAANHASIQDFRDGNQFEFNGQVLYSETGDLMGALLPHLSQYRGLARAMVVDGRLMKVEGDVNGALDSYLDVITAGGQTGRGQTLIDHLVGTAMQAVGNEALLDTFESAGDEIDYQELAARMQEAQRPMRPLDELIQFERGMFMDTAQRMFEIDPASGKPIITPESLERSNFLPNLGNSAGQAEQIMKLTDMDYDQTRREANEYYDRMTEAFQMPYQQQREAFQALEQRLVAGDINPLVGMLVPSLSRAGFVTARGETARRGTELVANIKAYQQRYGELPESLEVFGDSAFAIDPLGGGRFRYVREGDGFRLYSTGQNGLDDGGVHDPRAQQNDYVIWPRPKKDE